MLDTASAIALLTGKHRHRRDTRAVEVTLTIALALARGAGIRWGHARRRIRAMYGYLERGHLRDAQLLTDDIRALSSTEAWPTVRCAPAHVVHALYDYPISTAPRALTLLTRMGGDTLEPVFLGMMAALEGRAQDVRRYTRDLDSIAAWRQRGATRPMLTTSARGPRHPGARRAHRGDSPSLRGLESAVPALRASSCGQRICRYQLGKLLLAAGRARRRGRTSRASICRTTGSGSLRSSSSSAARRRRSPTRRERFTTTRASHVGGRTAIRSLRPWREEAIAGVARG